jgi:hypothetical protein
MVSPDWNYLNLKKFNFCFNLHLELHQNIS